MPKINIPPEVVPGFKAIIRLSKKSLEQISGYLINATVSRDPNEFLEGFDSFIKSKLKIKDSKEIVQTISSFVQLATSKNEYETLTVKLSNSFKELYSPDINEKDFNSLHYNLSEILKSSVNLNLSAKAYNLLRENQNVYSKSKVISDVRIVFNDDLESKERHSILVHNLHIKYRSEKQNKEFFLSLDLDDLKDIQEQIERAIKKDKLIKKDYKNLGLI
jgi:hypothetical protein